MAGIATSKAAKAAVQTNKLRKRIDVDSFKAVGNRITRQNTQTRPECVRECNPQIVPSSSDPVALPLQGPSNGPSRFRHPALERTRYTLTNRSGVDGAQAARNVVALLEVLGVERAAIDRFSVADRAELLF